MVIPDDNSSFDIIQRYFAGLAENTFQSQLGVVDPPLVDYVSDMLVRFIRSDTVHRIRGMTGHPLLTITEMREEATQRLGDAKRAMHRHIGDFTLFWAGIFPEALQKGSNQVGFEFESYCSQGKLSYLMASEIECDEDEFPDNDLLARLSERFELCVYGLQEVRREWERGDESGGGSLLLN